MNKIQLYSLATPNGQKVSIMLEELGLDYDLILEESTKTQRKITYEVSEAGDMILKDEVLMD